MSDFDALVQQRRSSSYGPSNMVELFKMVNSKDRLATYFGRYNKLTILCGQYIANLNYEEYLKFKMDVESYIQNLSRNIMIEWGCSKDLMLTYTK